MKKLSIEEKAKAYDEAIKKAESLYKAAEPMSGCNVIIETLFPELKESEGEKIRRLIKNSLKAYFEGKLAEGTNDTDYAMCLAWLEKQAQKKTDEEVNGEDYGIDSLYHAQRILEKTLGSVDGYQSDDGILEHKCAISAVKELYGQKPWSEDDEKQARQIERIVHDDGCTKKLQKQITDWLKSLKNRVQPQSKQEWSEEYDVVVKDICDKLNRLSMTYVGNESIVCQEEIKWLKSIKDRVQPKLKQEWNEDDERHLDTITSLLEDRKKEQTDWGIEVLNEEIAWLKSIRTQNRWKPSDEQMEALYTYIYNPQYFNSPDPRMELVESVYKDLKKLKGE